MISTNIKPTKIKTLWYQQIYKQQNKSNYDINKYKTQK